MEQTPSSHLGSVEWSHGKKTICYDEDWQFNQGHENIVYKWDYEESDGSLIEIFREELVTYLQKTV